jgi:hypothetical protein
MSNFSQELGGAVSYLSKQIEQLLCGLLGHSAYPVRRAGRERCYFLKFD